jgi:hypothetical protein
MFSVRIAFLGFCLLLVGAGTGRLNAGHGQSLNQADTPSSAPPPEETPPSFGRILLGSTAGTSVGVGLGLLVVWSGDEAGRGDYSAGSVWADNPEVVASRAEVIAGLAAIAAGGPIGAVEIGGIDRRRGDAYVTAGFGEFVLGVAGLALADRLHDSTTSRLVGLGTGVAVGAAGGAYWVASQSTSDGLFRYQDGRWQVGTPAVRVRPHLTTDRAPSVGVALVSAQL